MNGHTLGREFIGGLIAQQEHAAGGPSAGFAWHVLNQLVKDAGVSNSEEGGGGIAQNVSPFRAVLVRVHGGVSSTDTVGTVGERSPLNGVVQNECNTVAGLHTDGSELLAYSGGEATKFVVRDVGTRHTCLRDVAKTREVAEAVHAGHQHLIQSSGVVAFGLLPLSVVGLAFPCKLKGFHAPPVWR